MQEDYQNINENNENKESENQIQSHSLKKSQKIAVAILVIFTFAIMILWIGQFKKRISDPLSYKPKENKTVENNCSDGSCDKSEEDLRTQDTDGDGLSDWDELNIYLTSPYIEDSDSDGFSDKQEIDNDKDPNCPSGRDCYGQNDFIKEKPKTEVNNIPNIPNIPSNNDQVQNILQGNSDANSLRKMLINAGMDEKILNQISDEDLMKSYQETLEGQIE